MSEYLREIEPGKLLAIPGQHYVNPSQAMFNYVNSLCPPPKPKPEPEAEIFIFYPSRKLKKH